MHAVSQKPQSLDRIAKLAALLCGVALVVVSIYPEDSPFKNTDPSDFVQDQWNLLLQLKWLIGILLIAFGLLYPSRKLPSIPEYSGARDLSQDGYKLYLLNKYRIEKNSVLDQISCHERFFPNAVEALMFAHALEYAGESAAQKLNKVRAEMRKAGAQAHVLNALDDIGYLLNLRGSDVPTSPYFHAYLLLTEDRAVLYAHLARFSPSLRASLAEQGIALQDYDGFFAGLGQLCGHSVLVDPAQSNMLTFATLP